MSGLRRSVLITLATALAGGLLASLAVVLVLWTGVKTNIFNELVRSLGRRWSNTLIITVVSAAACLAAAAPEGLRFRSFRRWLLVAAVALVGAAVAGIIAALRGESRELGFVAGTIGFGAGYGLGLGIARKSWLAMVAGVLIGQVAGLAAIRATFVVQSLTGGSFDDDPDGIASFFLVVAITIFPIAVAMECVDYYLARQAETEGADSGPPPEAAGALGTADGDSPPAPGAPGGPDAPGGPGGPTPGGET